MPIYEFVCMECEAHYEELVAMGASADCPDCGSANVRKQLSVFAAHGVESGPALRRRRRRLLRRLLRLRSLRPIRPRR